jgi:hypothetical protein
MSWDLAVWEGPRPATDDEAMATYQRLMDRYQSATVLEPPTPAIAAFVDALLGRYPDITGEEGIDSPWSDGPLIENATGPIFYFGMVFSGVEAAVPFIIEEARQRGLVCFNPQGPPYILA